VGVSWLQIFHLHFDVNFFASGRIQKALFTSMLSILYGLARHWLDAQIEHSSLNVSRRVAAKRSSRLSVLSSRPTSLAL
jgi:hypothetical protein